MSWELKNPLLYATWMKQKKKRKGKRKDRGEIRLMHNTYVMLPNDFISSRIGLNFAIKIAVISLFDVFWI
jgi:hypothetical protein